MTAIEIINEWLHTPTLLLRAGEMSGQEIRSVKAVLIAIRGQIKSHTPGAVHGGPEESR